MEITVKRIAKKDTYTIGKLYVDGKYICDTIEDKDRGLTSDMPLSDIQKRKVYGETAIPTGRYNVEMNMTSAKFGKQPFYNEVCKGKLPRIVGIKGYEGVLIHCGNSAKDSLGCILVGENKVVGQVINSKIAFRKLYSIIKGHNDIVLIVC